MIQTEEMEMDALFEWCSQQHDFSVSSMSWTDDLPFPLFHFRAILGKSIGDGISTVRELALRKAIGEAVERDFLRNGFHTIETSNGLAVHPCREIAARNAFFEIFERDIVLCHFATQTRFLDVTDEIERDLGAKYIKHLKTIGFDVKIGILHSERDATIAFAVSYVHWGNKLAHTAITAASCNLKREDAIEKVLLEVLMGVEYQRRFPRSPLTLSTFRNIKRRTPHDHARLNLSTGMASHIVGFFDKKLSIPESAPGIEFYAKRVEIDFYEYQRNSRKVPLHIAHARSPELQQLRVVEDFTEYANLKRLSEFAGQIQSVSTLNSFPHPYT